MSKQSFLIGLLNLFVVFSVQADNFQNQNFSNNNQGQNQNQNQQKHSFRRPQTIQPVISASASVSNATDADLVRAVESNRRVDFVKASEMKVVELLQDDTQGSPHQKFKIRLSDNKIVTVISNLDMCVHIPVQIGDSVGAGGQYIPTGPATGILHWVHADPSKRRPDGYVELNGHVYCK